MSLEVGGRDFDNIPGATSASLAPYCTSVALAFLVIWPEPWEDGLKAACNWPSTPAELCVDVSLMVASLFLAHLCLAT